MSLSPVAQGVVRLLLAVQAGQATLVGTVRDADTDAPLPGAHVALPDLQRATLSDADGRYSFAAVPPGPQHLTVRFIGRATRTVHALVPPGGTLAIDVALAAAPIPVAGIEVALRRPLQDAEGAGPDPFPDRRVSAAGVREHPLLAEPDAFLALRGGEVASASESPAGLHVRGGAADHTGYLLDGIPVFSPYHAAGVFSAWNPDALGELRLLSVAPPPELPDALSGTVAGRTRTPGEVHHAAGAVSTRQVRASLDGPLPTEGGGYLAAARVGFPGFIAPSSEASYLAGRAGDAVATLRGRVLGGGWHALLYTHFNELDASTAAGGPEPPASAPRNQFEWEATSLGGGWSRPVGPVTVDAALWRATGTGESLWWPDGGSGDAVEMAWSRRDHGLVVTARRESARAAASAGVRLEGSRTAYRAGALGLEADDPRLALFGTVGGALGPARVTAGLSVTGPPDRLRPAPRLRVDATAGAFLLTAAWARTVQHAQSLRNPESLMATVFPPDLFVGSGAPGVPTARSDQAVAGVAWAPRPGLRLGLQAWARSLDGLVLVAPSEDGPFAADGWTLGEGSARGAAAELSVGRTRWGLLAGYGYQRVRLAYADSTWVPSHGTTHTFELGAVYFPTATTSVRAGLDAAVGRRATAAAGDLEWEACNALDRGCEVGGSPRTAGPLGGQALPDYLALDLHLRKHWHLRVAGRDATVALYGTFGNVLSRRNVRVYRLEPSGGEPVVVGMRPTAPLVVGVDWRY